MWISVGAGFLFYWGLLITSLYYKHLWMDRNDKPKRIIVLGGNPDPAPQAWLGQKGHITQRGAAPHVNEHTSIHHRPHNPIIPQCLVRWLFSSSNQRPASPHRTMTTTPRWCMERWWDLLARGFEESIAQTRGGCPGLCYMTLSGSIYGLHYGQ